MLFHTITTPTNNQTQYIYIYLDSLDEGVASQRIYALSQLKEVWKQLSSESSESFPKLRGVQVEYQYDDMKLSSLDSKRKTLIDEMQKQFDQVADIDVAGSEALSLIRTILLDNIETHIKLEDAYRGQVDDARKSRIIGRMRYKLERSHVGDILPNTTWSLQDLSNYRELVYESTKLLEKLAKEAHNLVLKFSDDGNLSLPMQSAYLLTELVSLRAHVNEHTFFTLRAILQDSEDGMGALNNAENGGVCSQLKLKKYKYMLLLTETNMHELDRSS